MALRSTFKAQNFKISPSPPCRQEGHQPKPIGAKPAEIRAADWEGTWRHKVDLLYLKVLDADQGLIQAAAVEQDDEAGFKLKSWTIHLRTAGDWTLGSVKLDDSTNDSQEREFYLWARVKNDDDQLIFWLPDADRFKELVEKGTLPGRLDDNDNVILGELNADHLQRLASGKEGMLLHWEEPTVLFRVKRIEPRD